MYFVKNIVNWLCINVYYINEFVHTWKLEKMHKYRINILYINCDALKLSYNQYVNIYSQNRKTTILFLVFYFFIYKTGPN